VTASTLPTVAITATSGAGSYVGRVAVLADTAQGIQRPIISGHVYPRVAIYARKCSVTCWEVAHRLVIM